MKKTKNIGIEVKQPIKVCVDKNCPFHGKIKVRGRIFTGIVKSSKANKTVKIQFERLYPLTKYERFEKRSTKIQAHNPDCINAKEGDQVKIMETRPISKTKNFVVIEK